MVRSLEETVAAEVSVRTARESPSNLLVKNGEAHGMMVWLTYVNLYNCRELEGAKVTDTL